MYKIQSVFIILILFILTSCKSQYQKGYDDGYNKGYSYGKEIGYRKGEEVGYLKGFKEGEKKGYNKGYKSGKEEGYKEGTKYFIKEKTIPTMGLTFVIFLALILILLLYKNFYFLLKEKIDKIFVFLKNKIIIFFLKKDLYVLRKNYQSLANIKSEVLTLKIKTDLEKYFNDLKIENEVEYILILIENYLINKQNLLFDSIKREYDKCIELIDCNTFLKVNEKKELLYKIKFILNNEIKCLNNSYLDKINKFISKYFFHIYIYYILLLIFYSLSLK